MRRGAASHEGHRVKFDFSRGHWHISLFCTDPHRRRVCRERRVLVGERTLHTNRIKGLLFSQGVRGYEPSRRDRRERLKALRTGDGRDLPRHVTAQLSRELDRLELLIEQIKVVEAERDAVLAENKAILAEDKAGKTGPVAMLLVTAASTPRGRAASLQYPGSFGVTATAASHNSIAAGCGSACVS